MLYVTSRERRCCLVRRSRTATWIFLKQYLSGFLRIACRARANSSCNAGMQDCTLPSLSPHPCPESTPGNRHHAWCQQVGWSYAACCHQRRNGAHMVQSG